MSRPLSPEELYPAGVAGVTARFQALSTGIRVRVVESGPPDGAPVLMLHGWGASAYMFRHALAELPRQGYRVIAADLRGFGLSDRPSSVDEYSLNSFCGDLDALLDVLSLSRVSIAGQSMGGGLALRYALANPQRVYKLALVNPVGLVHLGGLGMLQSSPGALFETLVPRLPRFVVGAVLRYIAYGDASLVTERDVDEYWSTSLLPGSTHAARAALLAFQWEPLTDAEAASLTVPTLVMLGTNDRLIHNTPAAALRLRGATVESVPGGHCANEEHPDVVYRMISEFFRR